MLLTPLLNIHLRISPGIFEKIRNGPNGILRARGTLIYEKILMWKISCQTPLIPPAPPPPPRRPAQLIRTSLILLLIVAFDIALFWGIHTLKK